MPHHELLVQIGWKKEKRVVAAPPQQFWCVTRRHSPTIHVTTPLINYSHRKQLESRFRQDDRRRGRLRRLNHVTPNHEVTTPTTNNVITHWTSWGWGRKTSEESGHRRGWMSYSIWSLTSDVTAPCSDVTTHWLTWVRAEHHIREELLWRLQQVRAQVVDTGLLTKRRETPSSSKAHHREARFYLWQRSQISAYVTHKNLAVRKRMEAMRAAYAKSGTRSQHVSNYTWGKRSLNIGESLKGKRASFA